MGIVYCDFSDDLFRHFSAELRRDGVDVAGEIAKARAQRPAEFGPLNEAQWVCMQWYNVDRRKIPPAPRQVVWSKELQAKRSSLPTHVVIGLQTIENASINGADLTPFLSRRWNRVSTNDLLLNDWGIHHRHMDPARTSELLYVALADEALAFLDVRDHDSFAHRELVEIIYRNWPAALDRYWLKGILPSHPSSEPTDAQRAIARRNGVGTFITIDGKVFGAMGGGYVTTGMSVQAVQWADRLVWYAGEWQRTLIADGENVIRAVNAQTKNVLTELQLSLVFENRTMFVVERQVSTKFDQFSINF